MIERSYLRPLGRMTAPPGRVGIRPSSVLHVAGGAELAFASFERLHRHTDGAVDRRVASLAEIQAEIDRGGRTGEQLRTALAALTRPRPSVAGLALDRPRLMGIVNVTPDSFSDGGSFSTARDAIRFARQLADEGADILDIGGESTRPGSDPVSLDEELRRVMPVIEGLVGRVAARLSIDTRKAEVMRRAALAGVHMINDVSALSYDPASLRVAAETRLPVVLMHARGDPKTMQMDPRYDNVLLDVFDELAARIEAATRAGIPPERLLVDPGIGFGKSLTHNLELLAGLSLFHTLGVGLLLGASRKSFISRLSGAVDPADRLPGSIAAALSGAMQGAAILRVHDVAATRQALAVWEAVTLGAPPAGIPA